MHLKVHQKPRAYVDVETTGLDPTCHEIIEFAALKDNGDRLTTKISPDRIDQASPQALKVNGYTPQMWEDAPSLEEVAPDISEFLTDCVIIGHNIRFDMAFIETSLRSIGIQERLDYHVVDTVTLAYEHLVPLGLESLSLRNVCKFLGIPPEPKPHCAYNGAYLAQQVYHKLVRAGGLRRFLWQLR